MSFLEQNSKEKTLNKILFNYRLDTHYYDPREPPIINWVNLSSEKKKLKQIENNNKIYKRYPLLKRKTNNRTSRDRIRRSKYIVGKFYRMSKEEILTEFEFTGRDNILKKKDLNNKRIMFEILSRITGFNMLKFTSFCDNEQFILSVLSQQSNYSFLREINLEFTNEEIFNFNNISDRLKNDKIFLKNCYNICPLIILYFPNNELIKEYIDDINILKKIINYNYILNEKNKILEKICQCSDKWLKKINDEDFIYELLKTSFDIYFILSKKQKDNIKLEEFLKIYNKTSGHYDINYKKIIHLVKKKHLIDKDILINLIEIDKDFNHHISPKMFDDLDFCIRLIRNKNGFMHLLKPEFEYLRNNKEFILNLFNYRDNFSNKKYNYTINTEKIYLNLSDELKKDNDIIKNLLMHNGQNLWILSKDLFNWERIQLAYAHNYYVQNAPCNGVSYMYFNQIVCNKKHKHLKNLKFFKNCLPINFCYKRLSLSKIFKYGLFICQETNIDFCYKYIPEDIEIMISNMLNIFNQNIVELMINKEISRIKDYNLISNLLDNYNYYENFYNIGSVFDLLIKENPHFLKE